MLTTIHPDDQARRKMAVAVARELLDHIDQFQFDVSNYIVALSSFSGDDKLQAKIRDPEKQIQDIVYEITPHCRVCVLGGLLFAKAAVADNLTRSRVFNRFGCSIAGRGKIAEFLEECFSSRSIDLMEIAFEVSTDIVFNSGESPADRQAALLFGIDHHPDDIYARVRSVMKNIIDHDGEFVVTPVDAAGENRIQTWLDRE